MYRIEVQSASSEPFSGLGEAQEAHIALTQQVEGLCTSLAAPENDLRALASQYSDAGASGDVRETALQELREIARFRRAIRAFEWRLAATGKVIADPQQRSLAQSLLDYWALRHVELRDRAAQFNQLVEGRVRPVSRRPVSPRTLVPVDESLAKSLTETAEETYLALGDDAQRDGARDLFLSIATPYGRDWVIDPEIAARFTAAGVVVASGSGDTVRYTLAHDSVASQWERMIAWMKAARDEDLQFERVLANARNWDAVRFADLLPQGEALAQAKRFESRDPTIAAFVAAADAEGQRKKRVNRGLGTLIGFVGLAGVGYVLFDNFFRSHDEPHVVATDKPDETVKAEGEQIDTVAAPAEIAGKPTLGAAPTDCATGSDFTGWIWAGSNGDSQVFSRGGKAIEPGKVTKGQQLSMRVWLNVRESMPPDDGSNIAGKVKGTASARAPAVALANPTALTVGDTMQYWLPVRLPASVYVQVPEGTGEDIEGVRGRLQQAGLEVPQIERLPLAAALNEVRYYYEQDAARAQQVACLANEALGRTARQDRDKVRVRSLVGTPLAANVRNGTIELWVFPSGVRAAQSPEDRAASDGGNRRVERPRRGVR